MSRHNRDRRRNRGPGAARGRPDLAALEALCEFGGLVEMEGRADPVPVVRPRADFLDPAWDHMEFDAAVCAAGVPAFVRPTTPSDQPAPERALGPPPPPGMRFGAPWILVVEQRPGMRLRHGVELRPPHPAEPPARRASG
jgi:hypothetical protein